MIKTSICIAIFNQYLPKTHFFADFH